MSVTVPVRPARPDEIDAAGDLAARAYLASGLLRPDDPYLADLRDARGRSEDSVVLVADAGGDLAGTITWCPEGSSHREIAEPGEGEFRSLGVAPACRGQGVGRALVLACLDRARESGCHAVVLSSSSDMTAAHRVYAALGFARLPERDWGLPGMHLLAFRRELG